MQCVDGIHSIFNNFHRFFYINFHNFSIFLKKKKYCFIKSDIHYIFVNSKYCMNHFFIIIQSKLFTQRFMYRNFKFLYFFFQFLYDSWMILNNLIFTFIWEKILDNYLLFYSNIWSLENVVYVLELTNINLRLLFLKNISEFRKMPRHFA